MVHLTGSAAAAQPKRDAADRPFTLIDGRAVDLRQPWPFGQRPADAMRAERAARRAAEAGFLAKLDDKLDEVVL